MPLTHGPFSFLTLPLCTLPHTAVTFSILVLPTYVILLISRPIHILDASIWLSHKYMEVPVSRLDSVLFKFSFISSMMCIASFRIKLEILELFAFCFSSLQYDTNSENCASFFIDFLNLPYLLLFFTFLFPLLLLEGWSFVCGAQTQGCAHSGSDDLGRSQTSVFTHIPGCYALNNTQLIVWRITWFSWWGSTGNGGSGDFMLARQLLASFPGFLYSFYLSAPLHPQVGSVTHQLLPGGHHLTSY